MSKLVLALLAVALCGALKAQTGQPGPPTLPLVQPMPSMVHFDISFEELPEPQAERESATEAARDRVTSIEFTKTGSSRKLTLKMRRGPAVPIWILEDLIFTRGANGNSIFAENYNVTLPGYLQAGNTFYGVEWVALEHYKGIETIKGRPCYYYEGAVMNGIGGGPVPDQGASIPEKVSKAWIDVETKLPVAAVLPEGKCSYHIYPAPTEPLVVPEDYAKRYARLIAEARRRQQESSVR